MLVLLSLLPLLCLAVWIFAESRGNVLLRRLAALAAMLTFVIVGFVWGGFAEAFRHMEFPIPGDIPLSSQDTDTNRSSPIPSGVK